MDYFTYRRFKGKGIDGAFNLPFGTVCSERDGFLYAPDGRRICAATSENGWEHFRPNTPEGEYRQALLGNLYRYYADHAAEAARDFDPEKWPGAINTYWKNLLRTMPTEALSELYKERLGAPPFKGVFECSK